MMAWMGLPLRKTISALRAGICRRMVSSTERSSNEVKLCRIVESLTVATSGSIRSMSGKSGIGDWILASSPGTARTSEVTLSVDPSKVVWDRSYEPYMASSRRNLTCERKGFFGLIPRPFASRSPEMEIGGRLLVNGDRLMRSIWTMAS